MDGFRAISRVRIAWEPGSCPSWCVRLYDEYDREVIALDQIPTVQQALDLADHYLDHGLGL